MGVRIHFCELLAVVSGGTTLAAWQDQLEWGIRITAGLVAIAAGVASLIWRYRSRTKPPSLD